MAGIRDSPHSMFLRRINLQIVDLSDDGYFVMVTLNNGSEIRFSAHTNDRKDRPWYWPSGARYYKIVNV